MITMSFRSFNIVHLVILYFMGLLGLLLQGFVWCFVCYKSEGVIVADRKPL